MCQQMGVSFTFKRDGFTPAQYFTDTQEDLFDVVYLRGAWSLSAKIENLARKYEFENENGYYTISSFGFLKELLYILRDEKKKIDETTCDGIYTTYSLSSYRDLISANIKDLEWLLFYLTGRIAASEFFKQLSVPCFQGLSRREDWVSMCKAWGNAPASDFKLIFWIR